MASLKDFMFYDKVATGKTIDIPLADGVTPSGETLTLRGPESDEAVKASRAFYLAYRRAADELEPMKKAAEESGDHLEYNLALKDAIEPMNAELAAALVKSWSLDDPCTPENVSFLLSQHRALVAVIIEANAKARDELQEK